MTQQRPRAGEPSSPQCDTSSDLPLPVRPGIPESTVSHHSTTTSRTNIQNTRLEDPLQIQWDSDGVFALDWWKRSEPGEGSPRASPTRSPPANSILYWTPLDSHLSQWLLKSFQTSPLWSAHTGWDKRKHEVGAPGLSSPSPALQPSGG